VLDNGSTDDTAAVLAGYAGPHPLTVVSLPVNVGAPAARNWLASLPEVRACDWALYLDDDTDLPPDLRGRFGAAVAAYPGAGVWGCKVSDFDAPGRMQSADLHLVLPPGDPSRPALDLAADEPNPFRLSDLHVQEPDLGRFDYLRPCCSVTGCCHLFRTESLAEVGGFSLFLSPTQYDDVERDLRSALAGKPAVYQGHLAVGHRKSTGAASRTDPVAQASALANKYKMQAMHERSRILALAAWERELLLADLAAKARTLDHNP
jgi:GT2 family glycosyltransferase